MNHLIEIATIPKRVRCGAFELIEQQEGSLTEVAGGGLVLQAEAEYLVLADEGAEFPTMGQVLTVPKGGSEGSLRFGNFVGLSELGGRRLIVESRRISRTAFGEMLDEVAAQLASLPFQVGGQVGQAYSRGRAMSPDALWHAYVCLRDAMAARNHDLPGAMERILARPYETLGVDEARLVPLGQMSTIDADTVTSVAWNPELLTRPSEDSSLLEVPMASRLGGLMPSAVRIRPPVHATDNAENRFLLAMLNATLDICRQIEILFRESNSPSRTENIREVAATAKTLLRWRRHPVFLGLSPSTGYPGSSTVLRGRNGYREVSSFYADLMARTRLDQKGDVQVLLETRDAADIYEIWCFFAVVDELVKLKGEPSTIDRLPVDKLGAKMPWKYQVVWPDAELTYNKTFSKVANSEFIRGKHSYSVGLRPDITLATAENGLHLFDAKFKLEISAGGENGGGLEGEGSLSTFKNEDLHKMHAYRDATGAQSVWILYPGSQAATITYHAPESHEAPGAGLTGVGAIALSPDCESQKGIVEILADVLGDRAAGY